MKTGWRSRRWVAVAPHVRWGGVQLVAQEAEGWTYAVEPFGDGRNAPGTSARRHYLNRK